MGKATDTVFVGVYGSLQLHPWFTAETELVEDVYSLFMSRSELMSWSSSGLGDSGEALLWGMNEAEIDPLSDSPINRIAWFQVGDSGRFTERPLPLLPLLVCIDAALGRVGRVKLHGLQLFLPLHDRGSAVSNLISGLNWFGICDPSARTSVRITIDGELGSALSERAPGTLAALQQINSGPFRFDSISVDQSIAVDLVPPVVDEHSLVVGTPRVTLVASAPEWSFDALGWIVSLVADICRPGGATTIPVLMSISR